MIDDNGDIFRPVRADNVGFDAGGDPGQCSLASLRRRIYACNIQGRGGTKIPDLKLRTANSDFKVLFESNCKQGGENSINLNCAAVALVAYENKKLGVGTAVMARTFDPNSDKISYRSSTHELVAMTQVVSTNVTLTVVGGYRSPNFRVEQTRAFYAELGSVISTRIAKGDDVVIVVMDDNSSDITARPYKEMEAVRRAFNGVHVINEPTRKSKQPDHALTFYDPLRFTVTGFTSPGVGDHEAMIIDVEAVGIQEVQAVWNNKRKVVVDAGDPAVIDICLRNEFYAFTDEAFDEVVAMNDEFEYDPTTVARSIVNTIESIRERNRVYETRRMPEPKKATLCKHSRKVQYQLNPVARAKRVFERDPSNPAKKDNLVRKKEIYRQVCVDEAQKIINRDIDKMAKDQKINTRRFFAATGMHMRFDGAATAMSSEEVKQKLEKAELNYVLRGEPATLSSFSSVVAKRKLVLNADVEYVAKRIRGLNKVDKFYKAHADELAKPISWLLKCIEHTKQFPADCKIARLVLLPTRTIFYLDFLAKIIEDVINDCLHDVLPPEVEGQFAYQKGRSTDLCIAIGLHRAETAAENCINIDFDCKKAFDSTYWITVLQRLEEKTGSGRLFLDYLTNRSYIYKVNPANQQELGEIYRGFTELVMGRGAPPGTILGVPIFSEFQETDVAMNLSNKTWLWPGKFSDDKSPLALWSRVVDGSVQYGLDGTWKWRGDNHIDYHLEGDKQPYYYVFRREGMCMIGLSDIGLRMGDHVISRRYEKVQLGIRMRFFEDDVRSNSYGYELIWRGKEALSRSSWRLQNMMHLWDPNFTRTCVRSYVIGKLQYGASLYWLRASSTSKLEARFDYTQAMAAACGLTAPEVVGLISCGSKRSVKDGSANFKKLCRFLDLPTLKDIAISHARRLLKQWAGYEPDLFRKSIDGRISSVVAPKGSLLSDLLELSLEKVNAWYPEYYIAKASTKPEVRNNIPDELLPEWRYTWDEAISSTKKVFANYANRDPAQLDFLNTYWIGTRHHFRVLERVERAKKRLDARVSAAEKRSADDSQYSAPKRRNMGTSNGGIDKRITSSTKRSAACSEPLPVKRPYIDSI